MTTVSYVYGIVPADAKVSGDTRGVGKPPGQVDVVRHERVAALVSEIDADSPLGTPEDLTAHAGVLDTVAADNAVLPLRFGAVVKDAQAVTDELLSEHHDEFTEALKQVEGKAEYIVKGRYDEPIILSEVLAENKQAQQLQSTIRERGEDASRDERIRLGELVNDAVVAKRDADTRTVVQAMEELGLECALREPTHELDAVNVGCLCETSKQSELEKAVTALAHEWSGRADLRLLGPLAPYDFVVTPGQQA